MNPYEYFDRITGVDENGNPKAIVTIQNLTPSRYEDGEPLIHDKADTTQAVVGITAENNWCVVSLLWDDFEDSEYIRFKGFLKEYKRDTELQEGNRSHYMVMTLSDIGNLEYFVRAIVMVPIVDSDKAMIRFLCNQDNVVLYPVSDDEMTTLTDEVVEELDYEDEIEDIALM